jgi:nicotinate-nucleotide adenylyltransferase
VARRAGDVKLGVFGGTFDPIHHGHLAIALAALESLGLERVVFVPARRSPLKDVGPVASAEDRVAMLERALDGEPRFECSRIELERDQPSYTVETLEALRPRGELFFILGADAARDLEKWHSPERIRELATLVIARRPGSAVTRVTGDILLDSPLMDMSARDLRSRAAAGRSLRYLVPDAVWRYIDERGLYRAAPPAAGRRKAAGGRPASNAS